LAETISLGQVHVGGLIIERTGFVARTTQGQRHQDDPAGSGGGVQWKKARLGTRGYIEVSVASSTEQ
jgi:hypothetical protein